MKKLLKDLNKYLDLWKTFVILEGYYKIGRMYAKDEDITKVWVCCDITPEELVQIRSALYSEATNQLFDIRALPYSTFLPPLGSVDITEYINHINNYDVARCQLHQELHRLAIDYASMQKHFDISDKIIQMLWLTRMSELYVLLCSKKCGISFTGNLVSRNTAVCEKSVYAYFEPNEATTIVAMFLFREALLKGDIDYSMRYSRAIDLMGFTDLRRKLLSFDPFEHVGKEGAW